MRYGSEHVYIFMCNEREATSRIIEAEGEREKERRRDDSSRNFVSQLERGELKRAMERKIERTNYLEISCSLGEPSDSDFYCIIDETAFANSRSNPVWYIYYDNTVWFLRYYATTIKITSRQHRLRI